MFDSSRQPAKFSSFEFIPSAGSRWLRMTLTVDMSFDGVGTRFWSPSQRHGNGKWRQNLAEIGLSSGVHADSSFQLHNLSLTWCRYAFFLWWCRSVDFWYPCSTCTGTEFVLTRWPSLKCVLSPSKTGVCLTPLLIGRAGDVDVDAVAIVFIQTTGINLLVVNASFSVVASNKFSLFFLIPSSGMSSATRIDTLLGALTNGSNPPGIAADFFFFLPKQLSLLSTVTSQFVATRSVSFFFATCVRTHPTQSTRPIWRCRTCRARQIVSLNTRIQREPSCLPFSLPCVKKTWSAGVFSPPCFISVGCQGLISWRREPARSVENIFQVRSCLAWMFYEIDYVCAVHVWVGAPGSSRNKACRSILPVNHRLRWGYKQSLTAYHEVVYKSRSFCAIFQLFGAASIQVRLLFKCGFYLRAAYMHMQNPESAKPVKAVWHM